MTLRLERVELWTNTSVTAVGTFQAVVPVTSCRTTEEILNSMVSRRLALTVSSAWGDKAELVVRRILLLRYTDGTFDEYRINEIVDISGGDGVISVSGLSIEYDLAEQSTLVSQTVGGVVSFAFTVVDTPANLFTTYVSAFAPSWCGGGMGGIVPTTVVSVNFSDDTPLSAAIKIMAACNALVSGAVGSQFEFWLAHAGTALYTFNLGYLSQSVLPDIRTGKSLVQNRRTLQSQDQTTRGYAIMGENQLGDNQWVVATVTANTFIEVDDINGGLSPLLTVNGNYLVNLYVIDAAGGAHQITACSGTSSTRAKLSMTVTAPIAVGDWVRIATDSAGTQLSYLDDVVTQATYGVRVGKITAKIDGATNWHKNPDLGDWTGALPASWTLDAGANPTKTTTAGLWVYGGQSARITVAGATTLKNTRSVYCKAGQVVTYSAWVYLTQFSNGGSAGLEFTSPNGGTTLRRFDGTDSVITTLNAWTRVDQVFTVTAAGAKTITMRVIGSDVFSNAELYFDSAQFTQTTGAVPFRKGSGAAANWIRVLQHLVANASPIANYDVTTLDLYRMDPVIWSSEVLTLGAYATIRDTDLGIPATSIRLVRLDVNHLNWSETKATLSTAAQQLTRILGAA